MSSQLPRPTPPPPPPSGSAAPAPFSIQQAHAVSQNSSNHPSDTSSPSASIHRTNGGMNKGPSPPTTLPTKPSGVKSILTAAQVKMQQAYTDMDGEGRVSVIGVLVLSALSIGTVVMGPSPENLDVNPDIDSGDTAWMLTCTALVLLMTPGLAFFYGGMVDKKNILYTMFQSISAIAMVTCLWTFVGFSLAYGETVGHVIGNPSTFFLYRGVGAQPLKNFGDTIPLGLFSLFELKFAIITPPIISGAFTERISYLPYMCFVVLFSIFVYCPIVHAVWHPEGFLRQWGVLDFAGGLAVETASGYAALAGSIVFNMTGGGHELKNNAPHIPFIILGMSLLWFGWFGFNSGSAFQANGLAMQSFLNTNCAASAAMLTWLLVDKIRGLKPSVTSACVGAVVGLVTITPACGYVNTGGAFVVGVVGGLLCNICCQAIKDSRHVDDQLDVFPAHGLGGTIGVIMTGMLADKNINGDGAWGLFYGGVELFLKNTAAAVGVAVYTFVVSYLIFRFLGSVMDLHIHPEVRRLGLDASFHGESVVRQNRGTFERSLHGVPEYSKHGSEDNCDEDF
uniref:Ammonium transporter n=1 Tax=Nannochloropsis gaditana (strain CCMP526) TaxID=1093141 RepID=I2CRA2_NANGC